MSGKIRRKRRTDKDYARREGASCASQAQIGDRRNKNSAKYQAPTGKSRKLSSGPEIEKKKAEKNLQKASEAVLTPRASCSACRTESKVKRVWTTSIGRQGSFF